MSNSRATVMIPDAFERFIEDGHMRLHVGDATHAQKVAAFQEIINLLALLLEPDYGPDPDDVLYFRQMEDNVHAWGHSRIVSREAQVIGGAFLSGLNSRVNSPHFKSLLENTRRGE